jgi:RNA polymerase sigma-70 factor (ECF subfamily)
MGSRTKKVENSSLKYQITSPEVWQEVLSRVIPQVYSMFTKRGIHTVLAEELTQKSVFEAFSSRESYDSSKGTLENWIFGVANNYLAFELRRRQNQPRLDGQLRKHMEAMETTTLPDSVLEQNETKMLLNQALGRLSPTEQAVLRDKYMEDRSARQIGKTLKISEKAVHSLLYRARIALREKLIQLAPHFNEEQTL